MNASGAAPVCQVCGTALELAAALSCELCATPHHRDCWEYWGRCSTYACTGMVHAGAARVKPLRIVEEITISGEAAPQAPLRDFFDPTVTKRLMYFTPEGARFDGGAGVIAVQIPAERVPLFLVELTLVPAGWSSPVLVGGLLRPWIPLRRWMRRTQTAWLVRDPGGGIFIQLSGRGGGWLPTFGTRPFLYQPVRIEMVRTWETAPDRDGLLALMCRLALTWPEISTREAQIMDLSPVLQMPRAGEPREAFLEQLVRMRDVGRQVASMLGLAFHEQFAGNAPAPRSARV